jgi:endonuclease/exonuclease/phosphatase (EEP) superfamily protein YafD
MDDALHLMSLNVCGLPSTLPPLSRRAAEFGRRIEASDVDIVTFQEVWTRGALAAIRAGLPSYPHLACQRNRAGQPAGGLAIFSRRPVRAVRYASFRGVRPDAGGALFRAVRTINSSLQGVLTAEVPAFGALVANTHLTANKDGDWSADNRYHGYQRRQLERLHARLRQERGVPLRLVAGDFNVRSRSTLYPAIVGPDGEWRDPFADDDPPTFHVAFLPAGARSSRIDYALVSGDPARFPVLGHELRFTEPVPLGGGTTAYLSDHAALSIHIGLSGSDTDRDRDRP